MQRAAWEVFSSRLMTTERIYRARGLVTALTGIPVGTCVLN